MRLALLALATAPLLGSCIAAGARDITQNDRELNELIANHTPGPTQYCVDPSRLQGPQLVGPRDVIYRQSAKRVWRSTLREDCAGLGGDVVIVTESYGTQLCRGDRFQVVNRNSGLSFGYCFFGPFIPYDKTTSARR